MNTLQFMDKQIMDLSNSHKNDVIDLMNPQEDDIGSGQKEEIVPSYDFQPIRPIGGLQQSSLDSNGVGGTRVWNSADSKTNTTGIGTKDYGFLETNELAKTILEKDRNANNATLVSEIDQAMKTHADNILHALEGVSARISQLESRTRHLENSMDDLKITAGNNQGSTDGQLRQLENILREVQAGMQLIRDKQDLVESQLQPESESLEIQRLDNLQQAAPAPQQSHQQLPLSTIQPPSTLSLANTSPTASQQTLLPPVQLPNQFPANLIPSVAQREPYFPASGQRQEAVIQQYQPPPPQLLQPPLAPPPPPPQQHYQQPPHPQYSQPPPPPQHHASLSSINPPQPQPSLGHHQEETSYAPRQNCPPSLHQPLPTSGSPPSQQFYGALPHMYEPSSSRPRSGFSPAYGPPLGTNEPYSYSGSMKQQQLSSAASRGSESVYPQLPTARILPQALPTATGVGGGSAGSGNNRVPMDDVVDKLATMGFTRDQVRATVGKLTEKGQSVDLNVVLDKLMNEGEGQPQRGWFGR